MISLRLVSHLCETHIDEFKEGEHFPQRQRNTHTLHLELEKLRIYTLMKQDVLWWLLFFLSLLFLRLFSFLFLVFCFSLVHQFIIDRFFVFCLPIHVLLQLSLKLLKLLWLRSDTVAYVFSYLLRDDARVELEEVEIGDFRVMEVVAEAGDVDLSGSV